MTFTDRFNQFQQQNNLRFTAYKYTHVYISHMMIMFYKAESGSRDAQVIKDTFSEEVTRLCIVLRKKVLFFLRAFSDLLVCLLNQNLHPS